MADDRAIELAKLLQPFRQDFLYYAPRALKVRTKRGSISPLRLNRAQQYLHARIEEQKRNTGKVRVLGLKGRQQGFSTYIEARFYHKTSLAFGKKAVILAHQQASSDVLFEMAKRYHDNCPEPLQPRTKAANAKELHFADLDSGYAVATAGSKEVGRGWGGVQYFHWSEAAFCENAEDHFAGIGQAVPNDYGTEIVLESTGNGTGNLFHGMWQDAERGRSEYIPIFVPWFWQEEYCLPLPEGFFLDAEEADYAERYNLSNGQMAWRRAKIRDEFRGDVALFDQEYPATPPLAFRRVAGNPYIPAELTEKCRAAHADDQSQYARIMGVDPAEYGDDDSAIAYRQGRQVAPIETRHKIGTMELAGLVAIRADAWKPDLINVDCTGVGSGVADRLIELGYPVQRIHFGGRAILEDLYLNRRAEMWGELKKAMEDPPFVLPDDDVLAGELSSVQYTYDSSRRLVLESKEKMKARGIKSPDRADAVALTFASKVLPTADKRKLDRRKKAASSLRR